MNQKMTRTNSANVLGFFLRGRSSLPVPSSLTMVSTLFMVFFVCWHFLGCGGGEIGFAGVLIRGLLLMMHSLDGADAFAITLIASAFFSVFSLAAVSRLLQPQCNNPST
jgi:hypothetical protein